MSTLEAEVNEFAAVRAAIAKLEEREAELKALFVASGEKSLKGALHRVSISWICPKPTTDLKGLVDYLKPAPETIALFEVEKQPYVTVKLYGR